MPTPPGPVKVTSRTPSCRSITETAATSPARPMKRVKGAGSVAAGGRGTGNGTTVDPTTGDSVSLDPGASNAMSLIVARMPGIAADDKGFRIQQR